MWVSDADGNAPAGSVARIVATLLSDRPLAEQARRCGLGEDAFVALRAAFVAHGLAAFAEAAPRPWQQMNIRFACSGEAYARLATGSLLPTVERWLAEHRIDAFFFMNKHPGLRLRVRMTDPASPVDLDELARVLVEEGVGADVWRAIYEPETALFGGHTGMELAHRFFTVDSLRTLAHHRARAMGMEAASPTAFSVGWIAMLLHTVLGDRFEAWDVWCRVQGLGRRGGQVRPEVVSAIPSTIEQACRADDAHAGELARIGGDLREARDAGTLRLGLRQVLPFWIIFHWNRIGFGRQQQVDLAATLAAFLDPHG